MIHNELSFSLALNRAVTESGEANGIGTYSEKLLHRTLKYYFEPDESKHEVACFGSVADICNEQGIIEIQTRSFNKLIPKLERFLPNTKVTIVFPVIENKKICRINTETGERLPEKKSPKRGRIFDSLAEISMIRRFIPNDNLTILVVMVDVTETRMLNGKIKVGRKQTNKINSIPTAINSITKFSSIEDYRPLWPDELNDGFTAADFERCTKLSGIAAHSSLMLFLDLGILRRERKGREAYQYYIQ